MEKSQKDVENSNGIYPIYGSGGIIGYVGDYLCEAGSTIIGHKGTINNPIYVKEPFGNVDTAFIMKPSEISNDLYFYNFCLEFDFSKLDKSTTLPSLTKTAIGRLVLPFPFYNEQHCIVEITNKYNQVFDIIMESL